MQRERWDTPDGDFVDVDHVSGTSGSPVLVVLHGLEGSSRSREVMGLIAAAHRVGWGAIGVNFRSCSGEPNRLRRAYHGGDAAELAWIIQRVISQDPTRPVGCIGVSLGGNVLLKYLGEYAARVPRQVRAAVAISTPFDLKLAVRCIERGVNRFYMHNFVRSLKRKTWAKLSRYPDLMDPIRLRSIRTLAEFDDIVTAPIHGFPDGETYWRSSSSGRVLETIRRPTLLISAADDPFFPGEALPRETILANENLSALFVPSGGHMGFIAGQWPGNPFLWAEERSIAFLQRHLHE